METGKGVTIQEDWMIDGTEEMKQVSKQTWCLTSTETIRLIMDGEKGEVGGEGDYIPIATLSPPELFLQ